MLGFVKISLKMLNFNFDSDQIFLIFNKIQSNAQIPQNYSLTKFSKVCPNSSKFNSFTIPLYERRIGPHQNTFIS